MSSNAATSLRNLAGLGFMVGLIGVVPVAAQDDAAVTPPEETSDAEPPQETAPEPEQEPEPERLILDLSVTVPKDPSDKLIEQDCEEANDAGRVANEIIVCRQLGEATDGSFDKSEWEKRYAEKTKGPSTPDTFGIPNHGNPIGFGSVPPPALIIDVGALPEAPPGSDADRIARGLPPLEGNRELTEEEERARRLGVDAQTAASVNALPPE
ncbi:MAG: hypothetical protein AAF687_07665 [Pseudomonadota bacterium]